MENVEDIEAFAKLCTYAAWRLEKTNPALQMMAAVASINELWHWCLEIADGTDQSELALQVYAEAIAMRLEGAKP